MKDFKKMVVYQIYPKSFYDSNNDGYGDLKGVTQKLDYLKWLGVDMLWLTPFYVSPQNDNGYDVEDYYNIDPRFGSMEDFDELILEAKNRGIKIMLDMVFNHTSTNHEWFKRAMNGEPKYRDYYIIREGNEENVPTNWQSKFGGSAWEYLKEQGSYYLHLFDKTQADLNWENDEVRNEIYEIVNFWIKKGVEGFRLDVINLISKPEKFEDDFEGDGRRYYTDGPKIHQYLKELNQNTFGKKEGYITVGEMSSTSIDHCIRYSNPEENELSMVFSFHHLKVDYKDGEKWSLMKFDFEKLREILHMWQIEMSKGNGWNALFWCNHDQPRVLSRFGDEVNYRLESAKMLATVMHMMRGTPYVYQGEEIGMTNPHYKNLSQYKDVETLNIFDILLERGYTKEEAMKIISQKSRDNSRTPMQWTEEENAGFSTVSPWISPAENYKDINLKTELEDKNSVVHHYKRLIELRKEHDVISHGDYQPFMEDEKEVFSYIRRHKDDKLVAINNFSSDTKKLKLETWYRKDSLLISNYEGLEIEGENLILRPFESIVLKYKI